MKRIVVVFLLFWGLIFSADASAADGVIADFKVYDYVATEVTNALKSGTGGAVGGTISLILNTVILMTTIYYIVMGYQIMAGGVQNPMADFIKSAIKFILIASLALSVDGYNKYVADSFWDLQGGITSAWSGQKVSSYQYMDAVMNNAITKTGEKFKNMASDAGFFDSLRIFILSILVVLATLVVTLPAAAMILCANATMILLLAVGPFFVAALMFPVTVKWFEAWVGQVMTQIFTMAFLAMISAVGCRIVGGALNSFKPETDSLLLAAFQVTGIGLVIMWLLYRASNLAAGLAGGVSSSALTFGAMAASAMNLTSRATAPARALFSKSERMDPSSGQEVKASRMRHLVQGRTNLNPAYRQGMQKLYRNSNLWGQKEGGSIQSA